jgi:uncharacterized protein
VQRGYTVRVNGQAQSVNAVPGTYVSLNRRWRSGDRIDIEIPFSFHVARAIDDPAVQSVYWGPTLLTVQQGPVGDNPENGLIEVSLSDRLKLDGDLAAVIRPADRPLHFRMGALTLAPLSVADPAPRTDIPVGPGDGEIQQAPPTQPYHIYFRRREPRIMFGAVDSGVDNRPGANRLTFLEAVWDNAPFDSHARFVATVERIAGEHVAAGSMTAQERTTVVDAARRAESDLRV